MAIQSYRVQVDDTPTQLNVDPPAPDPWPWEPRPYWITIRNRGGASEPHEIGIGNEDVDLADAPAMLERDASTPLLFMPDGEGIYAIGEPGADIRVDVFLRPGVL